MHLSDTIYGEQFVVYHGSCSFLTTFFYFSRICCTLDMNVSLVEFQARIKNIFVFFYLFFCADKFKDYHTFLGKQKCFHQAQDEAVFVSY